MSHDNSSTSCGSLCNVFCFLPSAPSHLSLFLIFSLLALSSHLSCLHLSFCRLLSCHFFSLFTFFSLIAALFILCSVWSIVSLFSFFTSPIVPLFLLFLNPYPSPPPCQMPSLCPSLPPHNHSLRLFHLPTYHSFLFSLSQSVCLTVGAY